MTQLCIFERMEIVIVASVILGTILSIVIIRSGK